MADAPGDRPSLTRDERAARNTIRDANEHLELAVPSARRFFTLVGRALTLRCPHCGGGPVRRGWFTILPACGRCGKRLQRGEQDYFLGAMLFNLIIAELLFAAVFVTTLVILWPDVPWDVIQYAAPLGMAVVPFALYPCSKLLWLAADLAFRPEPDTTPHRAG